MDETNFKKNQANREIRHSINRIGLVQKQTNQQLDDKKERTRLEIGKQIKKNTPFIFDDLNTPVEYKDDKLQVRQISKELICISSIVKPVIQDQNQKMQNMNNLSKLPDLSKSDNQMYQHQIYEKEPEITIQNNRHGVRQSSREIAQLITEQIEDLGSQNGDQQYLLQTEVGDDTSQKYNENNQSKIRNKKQTLSTGRVLTEGSEISLLGSTQTLPKVGQKKNNTFYVQKSYNSTSDSQYFKTNINKSISDRHLNTILNQSTITANFTGGINNNSQINTSLNNKSQEANLGQYQKYNNMNKQQAGLNSSQSIPLNNKSCQFSKNKPSSILQKIELLQTSNSFLKKQQREFSDISHIDKHFTNIMDYPRCQEKIYDSILLSPKEIQNIHKKRLNKDKFWVKMALGNKTVQYQADLKKIMQNKAQSFVSEQKVIDFHKINILENDEDQLKKNILRIIPQQIQENNKRASISPNRRFSETINNSQRQTTSIQKDSNQEQSFKHYQSVKDSKYLKESSQDQLIYKNTTSRQDVQDLEIWLEQMLQQIYLSNDQSAEQLLKNIQLIYTACLKELIRQVSLQCTERGLLIQKVWDAYLNLFEGLLESSASEQRKQEKAYIEDINRISKGYQANVNLLQKDLSEGEQMSELLTQKLDQANQNYQAIKEMQDKYQSELKLRDAEIEQLKSNMKVIAWDNHYYQSQYENQKTERDRMQQVEEGLYQRLRKMEDEEDNKVQQNSSKFKIEDTKNREQNRQQQQNIFIDDENESHIQMKRKSKTFASIGITEIDEIDVDSLKDYSKKTLPFKTFAEVEVQTEDVNFQQYYTREEESQASNSQESIAIQGDQEKSINDKNRKGKQSQNAAVLRKKDLDFKSKTEQKIKMQIENEVKQRLEQEIEQKYKQIYSQNQNKPDKQTQTEQILGNIEIQDITIKELQEQLETLNAEKSALKEEIQQIKIEYEEQIQQKQEEIDQYTEREKNINEKEQKFIERERLFLEKEKTIKEKEIGFQIKYKEFQQTEQELKKQIKEQQQKAILSQDKLKQFIEKEQIKLFGNNDNKDKQINLSDWKSIYESLIVNPDIPDFVKENIERILHLLNQEKDSEIGAMKQNHDDQIKQINDQKVIDTERSLNLSKEKIQSSQRMQDAKNDQSELEDAKLEIEENKENISDLTNKNAKLINKVKQLKDIIRSQKNTIFKIQDVAKQLLAENKKAQAAQGSQDIGSPPVSISEDISQLYLKKADSKLNEPESLTVIEFVPIEQSPPTSKNKVTLKNIIGKSVPPSKRNFTKGGDKSPPQITSNRLSSSQRKTKLDNLMNVLDELTADVVLDDTQSDQSDFDDYLPTTLNIRKSSRMFNNKVTQAQEFKLGQIHKKDRTISANADAALKLLSKVQERIKEKKHQISQTKNNIIKFIISVYTDRIKNPQNFQNPLYVIAYDNIMQKYGLKKVAETKLQQYLESTIKYLDNSRVKMFSRFVKIQDSYETQDFDLYIKCLKYIDETGNNGVQLISQPYEKILVSYELSIESITKLFKETVGQEGLNELFDWVFLTNFNIQEIEKNKISEKNKADVIEIKTNPNNKIDFDDMMEETLKKYNKMRNNVMRNVEDIFFAADLDKNEQIELDEFFTLYRHVEKEKFDRKKVQEMFFNEADLISPEGRFPTFYCVTQSIEKRFKISIILLLDGSLIQLFLNKGEKALSLNKFASLSLQEGLFKKEKQIAFANAISPNEFVRNIDQLRANWKDICQKVKKRLLRCKAYTQNFKDIIEQLEKLLRQRNEKDSRKTIRYYFKNTFGSSVYFQIKLLTDSQKSQFGE